MSDPADDGYASTYEKCPKCGKCNDAFDSRYLCWSCEQEKRKKERANQNVNER